MFRCMVPQLAVPAILAYATSSADLIEVREIEGMIQTIERPVVDVTTFPLSRSEMIICKPQDPTRVFSCFPMPDIESSELVVPDRSP